MEKDKKKLPFSSRIKSYFFTGLIVWLPVLATVLVIRFLVDMLYGVLTVLPTRYQPEVYLGTHVPGIGVCLSLFVLISTGVVTTNFLGKWLVRFGERLLSHIPVVNTIYKGIKQILETIFSNANDSFRRVFLVEYPRKGMWAIAFQTGLTHFTEIASDEKKYTIFVPTTPNPTSGFLMMIDASEVIELDISVDEALKLIISLGVVQPDKLPKKSNLRST